MIVEMSTFFKAIVIQIDLFESKIINEQHFKTLREAQTFKEGIVSEDNGLVCAICKI